MYILAVDDERLALDALASEIEYVFPKAEIHKEKNAEEALEWVKEMVQSGECIEYAFLDIHLRSSSGLDLAAKLKRVCPKVKLFFCTAHDNYAFEAFGLCAKGYLLKPIVAKDIERVLDEMVVDWRMEAEIQNKEIVVQTFGNFEVFVNGSPLKFERSKAKELFAYLIDRHGASVTTEQISMTLWENEEYDRRQKNKVTTIVSSLKNTLKSAGIESVLNKSWNSLSIDISKIKCDAYDFEKGDLVAINTFHGEYMSNYSWAEFTTGKYVQMIQ